MSTFLDTNELAGRWRTTRGYLANQRYLGVGPKFIKIGAKVLYPLEVIEEYEDDRKQGEDGASDLRDRG
jgi:hypothetical protein